MRPALDILTHFLLAWALLGLFRRPAAERIAAGIGGYAPDLDVLWFPWANRVLPGAFPLVHRGWSHTVWGGPLLALALVYLVTRPTVAAAIARLSPHRRAVPPDGSAHAGAFTWGRATALAAILGAWTHVLVLDAITITGTPAFWPLTDARLSLELFFFGVGTATIASGTVLVLRWRRRIGDRGVQIGALVVVGLILLSGSIRLASRPDVPEDGFVRATPVDWRWVVAAPAPGGGVQVWTESPAGRTLPRYYAGNATGDALAAAELCRATGVYRAASWGGTALETVDATLSGDGAITVEVSDVLWRYVAATPAWDPFGGRVPWWEGDEEGARGVRCVVKDGAVVAAERPHGFWS